MLSYKARGWQPTARGPDQPAKQFHSARDLFLMIEIHLQPRRSAVFFGHCH